MNRRHLLLAALASGLALANPAGAESIGLSPEQTAAVKELGSYLNSISTLQGEFTQTGSKGNVSKGVFYISKPGKMRFEYASPNPMILVSDGSWVTIKNRAKNKADQYPLSQTPLRLVLSERINLLKEANILGVETSDGLTTVTLEDRKKTVPGKLVLVYDGGRKSLQQWVVIDGKGRRMTVALENVEAGIKPDPKLFKIDVKGRRQKAN